MPKKHTQGFKDQAVQKALARDGKSVKEFSTVRILSFMSFSENPTK